MKAKLLWAVGLLAIVFRSVSPSQITSCQGFGTRASVLEALPAIALNSLPVQAREVVTSEIMPACATASSAAMMDSASSASVTSRKSAAAGREVKADNFAPGRLNQLPHSRFSVLRCGKQPLSIVLGEPPSRNQSNHGCLPLRFASIVSDTILIEILALPSASNRYFMTLRIPGDNYFQMGSQAEGERRKLDVGVCRQDE